MKPFELSATVAEHGSLQLGGLPFPKGTPVEVSVRAKAPLTVSKQAVHDELDELYRECQRDHWDAHGANAVKPETLQNARRLIDSLPPEYPLPSVGAEPDGHITLEWYRATNRLLSVSVSPEAMLYWAALVEDEDPRGTCRLNGEVPQTILYWIRRVGTND